MKSISRAFRDTIRKNVVAIALVGCGTRANTLGHTRASTRASTHATTSACRSRGTFRGAKTCTQHEESQEILRRMSRPTSAPMASFRMLAPRSTRSLGSQVSQPRPDPGSTPCSSNRQVRHATRSQTSRASRRDRCHPGIMGRVGRATEPLIARWQMCTQSNEGCIKHRHHRACWGRPIEFLSVWRFVSARPTHVG